MSDIKTVIFYGRSGSGKGTQAVLLKKFLEEHGDRNEVLYYETGQSLRKLAEEDSVAGKLTKSVLDSGGLMPTMLVVWQWGDYFMHEVKTDKHLILDGVARRAMEAPLVEGALEFFERKDPTVILIDTPREWSMEKLLERGRADDTKDNINKRLDWYDENVIPAIDYFKNSDTFKVLNIKGDQPIVDVHNDVLEALDLMHQEED